MFCYRCGAALKEGAKFCNHCGAPQPSAAPQAPVPPQMSAPPQSSAPPQASVPPQSPGAPQGDWGTEYLDEQSLEGTEYLGEEEATEWLSPNTPWTPPRNAAPPPVPPAPQPAWIPPQAPPRRRVSPVALAAVIIVCLLGIAAIVVATLLSSGDNTADTPVQTGQSAGEEVNWAYYVGTWQLDDDSGAVFTLGQEGDMLSLSLTQDIPYRSIEGVCTPEEGSQRLTYADDGQGNGGSILLTPDGEKLSVSASSEDMGGLKYTGSASRSASSPAGAGGAAAGTAAEAAPSPALGTGDYLLYQNGQTVSYAPQDILTVTGDFHLWPTDAVRITEADLVKLTHTEIQAIRNEIYARYGYSFTDERWQKLFGGLSWYQPDPNYSQPVLPELIQDNVDTILAYETAQGWRS